MKARLLMAFVCLLTLTATLALANTTQNKVNLLLKGWVTRGGETLASNQVEGKPSETITWSLTAVNDTDSPVKNFVATLPVDKKTEYVVGSASTQADLEFSLDGGMTWAARPMIRQRGPDGQDHLVEAPVSLYTNLRFTYSTLPTGQTTANYQVRIK